MNWERKGGVCCEKGGSWDRLPKEVEVMMTEEGIIREKEKGTQNFSGGGYQQQMLRSWRPGQDKTQPVGTAYYLRRHSTPRERQKPRVGRPDNMYDRVKGWQT